MSIATRAVCSIAVTAAPSLPTTSVPDVVSVLRWGCGVEINQRQYCPPLGLPDSPDDVTPSRHDRFFGGI